MGQVRRHPWQDFGPDLEKWLRERFEREDLMRTCLTCHHWNEQAEQCKKFNNQRPPAKVIANGCGSYEDSYEIPF